MLVDVMRGLIYRDFNMKRSSISIGLEKMVELRTLKDGSQSDKNKL